MKGKLLTDYRLLLTGYCLLVLLLLAGCSTTEEEFVVEIAGEPYRRHFEPATLVVPVGSSVSWKNAGVTPETISYSPKVQLEETSAAPPEEEGWNLGLLYPGEHWSRTFTTAGTYAYFNRLSEDVNRFGFIIVEE